MRHTGTSKPLTSTVEQLKGRRGRAALGVLVASERLAVRAEPVAQVVLESPAVRVELARVVLESQVVRPAQVVLESPAGRVVLESPVVQGEPQPEQKLAVAEQTHVLQAGPAPSRPRSPAEAAALTVSAVINPQRAGAAEALSAEQAGHLPKRPAIAVAAAWEVGVVVEAEAAKKAAEDADAKRDERKKI